MKIVNEIVGRTTSAADSAVVALNATSEAYAYLEAERKRELGLLLKKAVEIIEKGGVDPQTAFNTVAARGQYIKQLSLGNKMFHQAAAEIKNEPTVLLADVKIA
ncbi:hypothetical protein D3C81_794270 [compost metagenome]